jgi:NAD-dependent DNA ligase
MVALEDILMAHRYLYYVLGDTVISDYQYDMLERQAREYLPMDHPLQGIGSSLASSYTDAQVCLAMQMLEE